MRDNVTVIVSLDSREQSVEPGVGGKRQIKCDEETWDIGHQQWEALEGKYGTDGEGLWWKATGGGQGEWGQDIQMAEEMYSSQGRP